MLAKSLMTAFSPPPPLELAYLNNTVIAGQSLNFSVVGADLGVAAPTREIFCIIWTDNIEATITSANIGGVSASVFGAATVNTYRSMFIRALVPNGATGNVNVAFSVPPEFSGVNTFTCTVIRVANRINIGSGMFDQASHTAGTFPATPQAYPGPIIPANGFAIGSLYVFNNSPAITASPYTVIQPGTSRRVLQINRAGQPQATVNYTLAYSTASQLLANVVSLQR